MERRKRIIADLEGDSDSDFSEPDAKILETLFFTQFQSSSDSETDSSGDYNKPRRKLHRVGDYLLVIERYDEEEFQEHFRMRRATCEHIIGKIEEDKVLPQHKFGRTKITAKKAVYMTVWYLSNMNTYREIADKFDVSRSTAHIIIKTVVNYLVSKSMHYIHWPEEEEQRKISNAFAKLHGIKGVWGAIDGSHIKIKRPNSEHYHVYCNRKGDYSILIQAVCDSHKRFLDIFCGEPGSIHDARMLRKSSLYEKGSNGFFGGSFLLGDSAYPCLDWLIPPFRDNGNLSNDQKIFNYRHSSTRVIIENAFGLLKGRFRRLKMFDNEDIDFIVKCTVAAAVLHNICINFDDIITYENDAGDNGDEEDVGVSGITSNTTRRDQLLQEIFTES